MKKVTFSQAISFVVSDDISLPKPFVENNTKRFMANDNDPFPLLIGCLTVKKCKTLGDGISKSSAVR